MCTIAAASVKAANDRLPLHKGMAMVYTLSCEAEYRRVMRRRS